MRILWFSTSASNASKEFGNTHLGVGWISALETIIVNAGQHELGICFIHYGHEYKKVTKNNVVYYGIPAQKRSAIKRIMDRQSGKLDDEFESPLYEEVINDFRPEIIHVFGTENGFGKILVNKFDRVIFHLQGLVAPYAEVYFPPRFSNTSTLVADSMGNMLRGLTFFHFYKSFNKRVKRETDMIRHWKYFSGRTNWDRNYVHLLNPSATYFNCEELLRREFFSAEWHPLAFSSERKKIVIGTTINPNLYKGLDLIYNVLPLLKNYDITWNIFGVTESGNLNRIVKKALNIKQPNPAIHFHGPVVAEKLVLELKKCHLFVHPSYIDNSPNSVCEAMLLGMPVVSSSVGGVKTLITNEVNGFLFNPHDRYDVAGLIAHLVDNYDLAVEAGRQARQTALKRHNSEEVINVINNMYNQVKNDAV